MRNLTQQEVEDTLYKCGYCDVSQCASCPIEQKVKDDCQCGAELARQAHRVIKAQKAKIAELLKEQDTTLAKELLQELYDEAIRYEKPTDGILHMSNKYGIQLDVAKE